MWCTWIRKKAKSTKDLILACCTWRDLQRTRRESKSSNPNHTKEDLCPFLLPNASSGPRVKAVSALRALYVWALEYIQGLLSLLCARMKNENARSYGKEQSVILWIKYISLSQCRGEWPRYDTASAAPTNSCFASYIPKTVFVCE